VTVLEAEPGADRDAVVARWVSQIGLGDDAVRRLDCRPREGGTWAGLGALFDGLLPRLREDAPELLTRHAHELCLVLPRLGDELAFPQSLTDTVDASEKTRNYPADRAYRSLHGLIDLLSEWERIAPEGPWTIVCEGYEEANALVHRFFTELVRRRGAQLGLRLLVVLAPGRGELLAGQFEPAAITAAIRLALPPASAPPRGAAEITREAGELERQLTEGVAGDPGRLFRLVEAWKASDSPERALRWENAAVKQYNHLGLYEAALPFAGDVDAGLERLYAEDPDLYFNAVENVYFCYVPLGLAEAALAVMGPALARARDADAVARYCYLMSMLHARFLQPTDQARAEEYLDRALDVLAGAEMPDEQRHFLTVFTMNGLALVRLRQRRVAEALELCTAGVARLNEHLPADRHGLHRSVLLFNIAQVHAQVGPYEDAVEYFGQAMQMDPNYSEYYNDRGGVFLKMDRLAEAERDYLRAIELSPPYAEVWTNLGQCYRAMGRLEEAVRAYSRALDLDPTATLALVGRADARLGLDHPGLALADYDRALAREPDQPLVLASRAIVHYEADRLPEAVADLDLAIELAPDVAELYQNRAVALRELGRGDEAARDLRRYLDLCPTAEDRGEVEESLSLLAA
jgi:tetratricopeptide (TPR) repeat protein